jgi:2-oxoglutarate dehydrogenase E2 component (dihydrolipoamide succinyltransferase)
MSVEVVMPQMGESITEGTVSKWLKAVGDRIDKDEPILEISTDKVDAEVPSPSAGTLLEIRHNEGETVEVGTILATIGAEGEQPAAPASAAEPLAEMPKEAEADPLTAAEPGSEPAAPTAESDLKASPAIADATEVVMPQMGESITEGTVSKWLKSIGDRIEKDEPLLEISTDKVDAEVPSPAAGTLLAINVSEGETVEVGSVLALVGVEGSASAPGPGSSASSERTVPVRGHERPAASPATADVKTVAAAVSSNGGSKGNSTIDELRRQRSVSYTHLTLPTKA